MYTVQDKLNNNRPLHGIHVRKAVRGASAASSQWPLLAGSSRPLFSGPRAQVAPGPAQAYGIQWPNDGQTDHSVRLANINRTHRLKKKEKKVTRFAFSRWPPSMSDQPTKVATQTPLCSSRFHQKTNTWIEWCYSTLDNALTFTISSRAVLGYNDQWTIHNITVQTFRLKQPSKGWEQKRKKKKKKRKRQQVKSGE